MANIGSLVIDLALESRNFINGLRTAQAQTNNTARSIQSAFGVMKGAAAGLVGALSVDLFLQKSKEAFDYADAIVDISAATGVTTKTLQEFRYAAQLSGSSVESADAALQKFTKNLGASLNKNDAMTKSLRALGVTAAEPDIALRQFMDGIQKLPTIAQRQAKAMEIMGKSAGDLTPLLGQGSAGYDQLARAAEQYGIVIEDSVLQNAGQVNDKLDTMKMILDAQFANMIVQNADALMGLANSFMSAASGAAKFFSEMRNSGLINISQGRGSGTPIARMLYPNMTDEERQAAAKRDVMKTRSGRSDLYDEKTRQYNAGIREGRNPRTDPYLQAIRAEREDIVKAEVKARRDEKALIRPPVSTRTLPTVKTTPKKGATAPKVTLKTDDELAMQWRDLQRDAARDQARANLALQVNPAERRDVERSLLDMDSLARRDRINDDTGTDAQVREGKKRLTKAQADQLLAQEQATHWMEVQALDNEYLADTVRDTLDITLSAKRTEADSLSAQAQLARTQRERRDIALSLVRNQFEQERLQLEQTVELAKLGKATKAEREAAEARLKALPGLQAQAEAGARQGTQGPLEAFLDGIPKTAEEAQEALERIQVEGLQGLQDDILGVIQGTTSMGDAFKNFVGTVINGLIKIAIQQAIIKPLAGLLFGSGEQSGSGGLLGSILKVGVQAATKTGARANGGLTRAGDYLMGERGPEIVRVGNTANVVPTRALSTLAANDNGGTHIHIGSITSNDPEAVRRMVAEGVMQATPMIAKQATDRTMAKLQRRNI